MNLDHKASLGQCFSPLQVLSDIVASFGSERLPTVVETFTQTRYELQCLPLQENQ